MASIKQSIRDGRLKKDDLLKVRYQDLIVVPGFNERDDNPRLRENDEELFQYIMAGGVIPPLEFRLNDEGGVEIVDGHRRHRAIGRAIAAGKPIEWVKILPFTGNDLERTARLVTSNAGLSLTPLETARVYKRLAGYGLSPDEIAGQVAKTRAHVEQMLILANANHDVHQLVAAEKVSAAVAIDAVRKHGDAAGRVLAGHLQEAIARGKDKVTNKVIHGQSLPRKVVTSVVSRVQGFASALSNDVRVQLAELEKLPQEALEERTIPVSAALVLSLLEVHGEMEEARKKAEERLNKQKAKEAQQDLDGVESAENS